MSEVRSPNHPIRILVVDDHPMMREGLSSVIASEPDLVLVGEAGDGAEAIEKHRAYVPDVTLMDLQMPRLDGTAAIAAILKECPTARIVVLTTFRGDIQVKHALEAGACGYILKSRMRRDLIEAIRAAHLGRTQIDSELAQRVAQHQVDPELSPRELDVLKRAALGNSNKMIAAQLGITEDTVKSYMKSILSKLHANDRTHAVTIALERGFLVMPGSGLNDD